MYGYVRAAEGELKMREYELYHAFYCGLCREMGRRTGLLSRFSLSYDATFFAIVRCAVLGTDFTASPKRCAVHPAKRRQTVASNDALDYTACAFAALTLAKLYDTKADERGASRLAATAAIPFASHWQKRAVRRYGGVDEIVAYGIGKINELEAARSSSIDDVSGAFGDLLGELAAYGTEGDGARLLRSIGELAGRFSYVCDACDDAAEDVKRGRYNPLVEIYGSDLCEKRPVLGLDRKTGEREVLRGDIAAQIKPAAMMLIKRLASAVDLIDFGRTPGLEGIVRNIVCVGMPGQVRRVLGLVRGDKNAFDPFAQSGGEEQNVKRKETEN